MEGAQCVPTPLFGSAPGFLERFREGSRDALETVYWTYVRRVETWVRRGFRSTRGPGVPGVRAHDLEDLVQEVFVKAFSEKARLSFDGLRDYGPFLFTIARNVVVDWSRKKDREITLGDFEAVFAVESPAREEEPWTDPRAALAVEAYLLSLSEDLAAVHRERYVLGHTQKVAAAALGQSRQQIRTRENRLRSGLDAALRALETQPAEIVV